MSELRKLLGDAQPEKSPGEAMLRKHSDELAELLAEGYSRKQLHAVVGKLGYNFTYTYFCKLLKNAGLAKKKDESSSFGLDDPRRTTGKIEI